MAFKMHGFEDAEVQQKMMKMNGDFWDPTIDRNMLRNPDRMIHIFTCSQRQFSIKRPPLFPHLILKACARDERYVPVAHIPDPLMQAVHNTENGRRRGEAHDGLRAAIDLLNPNNPTNDPYWDPSPEMAALFGSSKGCDLFAQGLFLSLSEVPHESEISLAESKRNRRHRQLIAHADSLEQTNRKELEEFLKGEDGTDLRMALDFYGEQRQYHKPMIATKACPNCGETIKSGVAFHKNEAAGVICVLDWEKTVAAGVKQKSDVPSELRWWEDEPAGEDADVPKPKARPRSSR